MSNRIRVSMNLTAATSRCTVFTRCRSRPVEAKRWGISSEGHMRTCCPLESGRRDWPTEPAVGGGGPGRGAGSDVGLSGDCGNTLLRDRSRAWTPTTTWSLKEPTIVLRENIRATSRLASLAASRASVLGWGAGRSRPRSFCCRNSRRPGAAGTPHWKFGTPPGMIPADPGDKKKTAGCGQR